jgi:hypothetical protein
MRAFLFGSFLVCCLCAGAAEKIGTAFGRTLGEVFDFKAVTATNVFKGSPVQYSFSPTNGFRTFNSYHVLITPISHRIYCIAGDGLMDRFALRNEQNLLMYLLREKYGTGEVGSIEGPNAKRSVCLGNRCISTFILQSDFSLHIQYVDTELEDVAEKERIQIESLKIDKSGL